MTTKEITLKAWLENNETVSAYQGEVDSRFLQISLIDNNGAVNLKNKTVQFYAKKPDGTTIFNNAEIVDENNGIINVMLTSQMSAVDGILPNCEIIVNDLEGATLKFKGINIIIIKTLPDTDIESSSESTTLQEIMLKINDMAEHQASTNNPHKVTVEQIGAATAEQGSKAETAIQSAEKGVANGIATLDANSKLIQLPTPEDISAVPISRSINNKKLSSDINLTAEDVGAAESNHGNHIPNPQLANNSVFLRNDNTWQTVTPENIGALPNTTTLPSKISDLENDVGFITEYTETDPTVPAWAKSASKPSYNFSEINNTPTTLSGYGITDAISAEHTHPEASTTEAGFLSAGDKAKLDKMEITSNDYLKVNSFTVSSNSNLTVANASMSVGYGNSVSGSNSVATGYNCTCSGTYSLACGYSSKASGSISAAIGEQAFTVGNNSISAGYHTTARAYNFACGRYNSSSASTASGTSGDMFIIGNGSSSEAKNAFRVTASGSILANAEYNSTGADYAELFEWLDSNINEEDRRGLFVTLDGDKIRLANSQDTYILGVVSGNPSVVGDNFDDDWCKKYLTDVFGTPILENKSFPAITDENGNVIQKAYEDKCFVLNPLYDSTQTYIPRSKRKEWVTVGIVGKLVVIDDGTCEANGYCYPSQNGIATNSINKTNYRVMKRIDDSHIQIFIK